MKHYPSKFETSLHHELKRRNGRELSCIDQLADNMVKRHQVDIAAIGAGQELAVQKRWQWMILRQPMVDSGNRGAQAA